MADLAQMHPVRITRGIVLHGGEAFASTNRDSATSHQRRSRLLCSIWGGNNGRTDPCATPAQRLTTYGQGTILQ